MEAFLNFICTNASIAHLIFFVLLLLAGLNIPISEDLVLLAGGMIVSTCIPEHLYVMWGWLYLGCILSAYEAYWLGRLLGPKLYRIPWLSRHFSEEKMQKLNGYYHHFGFLAFLVVRFIPGGVRNAFFMTAGLGGMRFPFFMLRDGAAALLQATLLYTIGYQFSEHWQKIVDYLHTYNRVGILLIFIIIFICVVYKFLQKREPSQ